MLKFCGQFAKFPGLKFSSPGKTSAIVSPKATNQESPVVILFGWLGASERHLGKYVTEYHKRGYDTIHYTPNMMAVINYHILRNHTELVDQELQNIIRSEKLENRKFMIHLFSNSGFYNWLFYQETLLPLNGELSTKKRSANVNILPNIVGTFIENAPCKLDGPTYYRGFTMALFSSHTLPKWAHSFFQSFWTNYLYFPWIKNAMLLSNCFHDTRLVPYPTFVIYSHNDDIISPSDTLNWIDSLDQKRAGKVVRFETFKSRHVRTFTDEPGLYHKWFDQVINSVGVWSTITTPEISSLFMKSQDQLTEAERELINGKLLEFEKKVAAQQKDSL